MIIRPYTHADSDAVWRIIEPVLRAGETYALPADWTRDEALAYWLQPGHYVFIAENEDQILGTYYLHSNQMGGGAHVANCAFMVDSHTTGRGIARAMCAHALRHAADLGFRAMQFNFVVSTNTRAVALWQRHGFEIVGTLPAAFHHPTLGFVDAYVMYRTL